MNKKGLGRGLGALLPTTNQNSSDNKEVLKLNIDKVKPNPNQPRQFFDEEKLLELASSIKEHGVVQPIIVRPLKQGEYEIVAGERRWRASQRAGLNEIPAIISEFSDAQISEIALIENIQREDLNPIEEAQAYKRLMEEFGLTQEQLSQKVGKSRSFIANTVRLLNLHPKVQAYLAQGTLSQGHSRPLLSLATAEKQLEVAERIIQANLSVRQAEELIKAVITNSLEKTPPAKPSKNPIHLQIEEKIRGLLGTKVKIKENGEQGKIEIDYYGPEDLQRIVDIVIKGDLY